MADWATIVPAVLGGGSVSWFGTAVLQWHKGRSDRETARDAAQIGADVQLDAQRDRLTFDLLTAAQGAARAAGEEAKAARIELQELRPVQAKLAAAEARLANLDEALEHIRSLRASGIGDDRARAERNADAFLIRMRRLGEAAGTMLNEIQRAQSASALIDRRGADA